MTHLTIHKSDVWRATLPDDCGNVGFIGIALDGTAYHVVVPVDLQIARSVKAGIQPEDGVPFGGYRNWFYIECGPYEADNPESRNQSIETNIRLIQGQALDRGIEVEIAD